MAHIGHDLFFVRVTGDRTLGLVPDLSLDIPDVDSELPPNERLQAMREGNPDSGLPLLYFKYGRYLLVANSAMGELPANLQGKWQYDYHHDINLQMNYWPAETGNLEYTTEALFKHIERYVPHGRKAAYDLCGCRGVWFPIQTYCWGRSSLESWGVGCLDWRCCVVGPALQAQSDATPLSNDSLNPTRPATASPC